ncbi:MAG: ScpA family protein [Candidatus Woesearchaeota archaeon]
MQEKIFHILVENDDIGWKSMIYELINSEQLDPWDIDISVLTQKYIEQIKKYKALDFKLSGKVLLAAAILLKIKSKRLVGDDINEFDRLLVSGELNEEAFYEQLEAEQRVVQPESYELVSRMPQPRKRKISVFDLVRALEKALEVKHRRLMRFTLPELVIPPKQIDITLEIKKIYKRILEVFLQGKRELEFSELLNVGDKKEKIYTLIPLLHLSNQRKIDLEQKVPFGEIQIKLAGRPASKRNSN